MRDHFVGIVFINKLSGLQCNRVASDHKNVPREGHATTYLSNDSRFALCVGSRPSEIFVCFIN